MLARKGQNENDLHSVRNTYGHTIQFSSETRDKSCADLLFEIATCLQMLHSIL